MESWVYEIGNAAFDRVSELVTCLQVDRERIAELEGTEDPEEQEELAELFSDASLDGEYVTEDEAFHRITEDPLEVKITGEWDGDWTANGFVVVLTTGGPAVRIVGEIDYRGNPVNPRLQVQDWGQPWTDYEDAFEETLLTYLYCFNWEV